MTTSGDPRVESRRRWVEALRSGRYEQGRNALEREGRFCCLGVLCAILIPEKRAVNGETGDVEYDGAAEYPTDDTLAAVGVRYFDAIDLSQMNDVYHRSFDEIADAIEKLPFSSRSEP